ncbi:MAG: hypothetical protein ACRDV9_05095 [Acidimicrobiia bacterium]
MARRKMSHARLILGTMAIALLLVASAASSFLEGPPLIACAVTFGAGVLCGYLLTRVGQGMSQRTVRIMIYGGFALLALVVPSLPDTALVVLAWLGVGTFIPIAVEGPRRSRQVSGGT